MDRKRDKVITEKLRLKHRKFLHLHMLSRIEYLQFRTKTEQLRQPRSQGSLLPALRRVGEYSLGLTGHPAAVVNREKCDVTLPW